MKTGIQLIAEERLRQATHESYTAEHDDTHNKRQLARAAAGYLTHYAERAWVLDPVAAAALPGNGPEASAKYYQANDAPDIWPFDWADDWKPKDIMSDLIRAGALVAAEIDRLQRIASMKLPDDGTRKSALADLSNIQPKEEA